MIKRILLIASGGIFIAVGLLFAYLFWSDVRDSELFSLTEVATGTWPYLRLARHAGLAVAAGFFLIMGLGTCCAGTGIFQYSETESILER